MTSTIAATASKKIHPLTKETIAAKTCVGLLHHGPYHEIGATFKKFFGVLNATNTEEASSGGCGASTRDGKVLGLYLDDPETTKPQDLRSYAALEIAANEKTEWPEEWKNLQLGGGPAAVMTVNGSYSQLVDAWQSFGKRVAEQGWKFSNKPEHISQEMYIAMDYKDESKNITKLVMFLEE